MDEGIMLVWECGWRKDLWEDDHAASDWGGELRQASNGRLVILIFHTLGRLVLRRKRWK